MPRDSKNLKVVIDIIKEKKIKYYNDFSIITPYVKIESNWNEFLRSHSQRFRKRYRNIVNRIEKLNNLEIKCVKNNDEISILKDVIEVSRNSWKEKEGIAISSKPYTLKFYEDLTKYVGKSGYLLLWLLKTNDIPIAMEYDIIYNDTVFALRSDFDQKYKSYSPGAYLEYKIISYLHENNFREYNTGPGLNQYKLNLCKHTHENKNFNLCNSNLKGLAIFSLNKIIVPIIKIIINKKK
jgi:CelD/BcsL family acetyltransferase involved in cellulose biosynthesis